MNYNRRRPMYTMKRDGQKETYNTYKSNHSKDIKKIKPESMNINKKCQVENDYYDMKPSLTKSPAQYQLTFHDDYCSRTSQDSFSHGGEDAASMISFGSVPSSSNGSENPSAAHSLVEVDTFLTSLLSKGVEEILETLLPMSSSLENCEKMRSSGCLPFLIQLLHTHPAYAEKNRPSREDRSKVLCILTNIVQKQTSDRQSRRESKVLEIIWLIQQYSDFLRDVTKAYQEQDYSSGRVKERGCKNVHITISQTGENLLDFIVCGKIFLLLEKIVSQSLYFRL